MSRGGIRELGESGESRASSFLVEKGFGILTRNFRYGRSGEIDIVAIKDDLVVFVEVKNRMTAAFGGALYSISGKKKRRMRLAAKAYVSFHPEYDRPKYTFRFDLISIRDDAIEWVEDILR
jgi:putative endonuclease